MTSNTHQVGGDHYMRLNTSGRCPNCNGPVQHWDLCQSMHYLEARCTAYVLRHRDKAGLQDLLKAAHFLQKIAAARYGVVLTFTQGEEAEVPPPPEYVNPD